VVERKRTIGGFASTPELSPARLFAKPFSTQRTAAAHVYGRGYALKEISRCRPGLPRRLVMAREIEVIKAQLRRNRVTVYEGNARFLDPHSMEVASDEATRYCAELTL